MSDEGYLRMAIDLAVRSITDGGAPFGAVVVHRDQVLGTGCNRVLAERDSTAHAEVVAIRAAGRAHGSHDLAGCVLYSSCEPCPMCLTAAYWSHVDRVVYAATRHDAARAGFDDALLYDELARPAGDHCGRLRLVRMPVEAEQAPFTVWADRQLGG